MTFLSSIFMMVIVFLCFLLRLTNSFLFSNERVSDQDIERFERWLFPHLDASLNPIRVRRTPAMGYGAFATRDLARGEIYSALPLSHVISLDTVLRSPLARVCRQVMRQCPGKRAQFDCLALFLIHEKRLGERSFWSPYIRMLPSSYYYLPTRFKRTQLEHMQASALKANVIATQQMIFERWEELKQCLANQASTFASPTWYEHEWAQGVVGSRAIWWKEENAQEFAHHLVPLADLINCRQLYNASAVHQTVLEKYGDQSLAVTRTNDEFKEGEEIFENYGKPNWSYFVSHGFILEPNEFDCVIVFLDGEKTPRCLNIHNIKTMVETVQRQRSISESQARELLLSLVSNHLSKYETTLEQDERTLESLIAVDDDEFSIEAANSNTEHPSRFKLMLRFRITEKRLLRRLLHSLNPDVHEEL